MDDLTLDDITLAVRQRALGPGAAGAGAGVGGEGGPGDGGGRGGRAGRRVPGGNGGQVRWTGEFTDPAEESE